MPRRSIISTSTRLIREFGGQVAISLAASAVAAAFLAAPTLPVAIDGAARTQGIRHDDEPAAWLSPIAPDGKIATRHRQAGGTASADLHSASAPLIPAALAMPMSSAWPQPVFDETSMTTVRARSPDTLPAGASAAPLRKASAPPERLKPADLVPMQIVSARPATQDEVAATLAPASLPYPPAPSPLARLGNVMSGAVGTVGAAGIWTLSQASSLLPRR